MRRTSGRRSLRVDRNTTATDFLDAAIQLLHRVGETQAENIAAAGGLLAESAARDGRLFAFGAGHSSLAAQDVVHRAGGLAVMNLLAVPGTVGVDVHPATLGGGLERLPGLAATVLDASPARAGDALVVVSLSGRNALPVEMAERARARGLRVVGVTSTAYAAQTVSRHASGTFLKDHCDVVVDSSVPVGDTTLAHPGVPAPFAPASTVVACALLQAVVAAAVGDLAARGIEPPLLRSGNVDGGQDWNTRVLREHREHVFHS
ncbi:sugar isomerase domain-containing protein [Streptomyces sp. TR06-5]|uniref:sugar isomerase domain-containing protein n=1 Tax=unclassified Streptomyces TaxID=2593676 RepID=UPI0039A0234D